MMTKNHKTPWICYLFTQPQRYCRAEPKVKQHPLRSQHHSTQNREVLRMGRVCSSCEGSSGKPRSLSNALPRGCDLQWALRTDARILPYVCDMAVPPETEVKANSLCKPRATVASRVTLAYSNTCSCICNCKHVPICILIYWEGSSTFSCFCSILSTK